MEARRIMRLHWLQPLSWHPRFVYTSSSTARADGENLPDGDSLLLSFATVLPHNVSVKSVCVLKPFLSYTIKQGLATYQ